MRNCLSSNYVVYYEQVQWHSTRGKMSVHTSYWQHIVEIRLVRFASLCNSKIHKRLNIFTMEYLNIIFSFLI